MARGYGNFSLKLRRALASIALAEENIMPIYECDCSKEKIERGLISLGKEEIKDIINTQVKIETVCHFCNKKYVFTKEELEKLLENIK